MKGLRSLEGDEERDVKERTLVLSVLGLVIVLLFPKILLAITCQDGPIIFNDVTGEYECLPVGENSDVEVTPLSDKEIKKIEEQTKKEKKPSKIKNAQKRNETQQQLTLGFAMLSPGGDANSVSDAIGFEVGFSTRYSGNLAWDFIYGISNHDDSGIGVKFTRIWTGPKFYFETKNSFEPYFNLGFGWNYADYDRIYLYDGSSFSWVDDLQISGTGFYYGFGIDFSANENGSLNINYKNTSWNGEDNLVGMDFDISGSVLSFSYQFVF